MNLHILPDSKFTEAFCTNMKEAGLTDNNKFVVRTNQRTLKHMKYPVAFAPLYSSEFSNHVGDVSTFDRVYIHQLSPLMYRWIASRQFKELNWMPWGTDLYSLPFVKNRFYGPETQRLSRTQFDLNNFLYLLKVYLTNIPFKTAAYKKIRHVLTWMRTEFDFAIHNVPGLNASHQYFFYENQMPYERIDTILHNAAHTPGKKLRLIIGNSGTPTNNHTDAIRFIQDAGIAADLFIPVSYGDAAYTASLKKQVSFYTGGEINFIDDLMGFEEYVRFLYAADALVMNHIRPQGYGNIFMMMYMNKPVFFNQKNISLPDLTAAGIHWLRLEDLSKLRTELSRQNNRDAVVNLLSHERLLATYRKLFT